MDQIITETVFCLVIDIIDSTHRILDESTEVRNSFNLALTQILPPFLELLDLDDSIVKFTGDGWIISTTNSNKLINLVCLGLLLSHKFNSEIEKLTDINFPKKWDLRLGISKGNDIRVNFNENDDFVGDSVRRATRISTLCQSNETLIDGSISVDIQRDFDVKNVNIDERIAEKKIKKFENDLLIIFAVTKPKKSTLKNSSIILITLYELGFEDEEKVLVNNIINKVNDPSLTVEDKESIDEASIYLDAIGRNIESKNIREKLLKSGYNRSIIKWNKILKLQNNYLKAKSVFEEMKNEGITPDVVSYNTLLNIAPDFNEAKSVFEEMKNVGIIPNVISYNTLLNIAPDFNEAKSVFEEMKNVGIIPNVISYNTLLNIAPDFNEAKSVFEEMKNVGIIPNVVSYTTLLNIAPDFNEAKSVFEEMKNEGITPDVVSYNTLLNIAPDFNEAKSVFEEMKNEGITPDVVSYTTLLNIAPDFNEAKSVFEEMKNVGIIPNVISYNTLLNIAPDFNEAKSVFEEMKNEGITPDVVSYNTLLNIAPDFNEAKSVFEEMKNEGITPDVVSYNTLLNIAPDFNEAKSVFEEMKNVGIIPNVISYNTLLNIAPDFNEAKSVFEEMKNEGIIPNVVSYNTLLNIAPDFNEAKSVFEEMKNVGLVPNLFTYCTLFSKDTKDLNIQDIHNWYLNEKFHVSAALESLIKHLFLKKKFSDAYYLILNYPHLGTSIKTITDNFSLSIEEFKKWKGNSFYDNNIDYTLGIAYYNMQRFKKAKTHLDSALSKCRTKERKEHINVMLIKINEFLQ